MGASPALAVAYKHPRTMGASPVLAVVDRFSERSVAAGVSALPLYSTAWVGKAKRCERPMGRRVTLVVAVVQLLGR